ncbi:MAG: hypothetical protein WC346_18435 [Methanogenium sp.]|jgi:hypothetical protein
MAYFKYIIVQVNGNPTPILFHPVLNHKDVFQALKNYNLIDGSCESAGEVNISSGVGNDPDDFTVNATGESVTLKIRSNPEIDAKIIKRNLDFYR